LALIRPLFALLQLAAAAEAPEAMNLARRAYEQVQAGQIEAAIAGLRAAARLAPANPLYRSALGGLFEKQGRLEEAVAEFDTAARMDARFLDKLEAVSLDRGAELARARRFRNGLPFARRTAARFPNSPRAAIMLGLFLMRNQENLAAVEAYRRAATLARDSAEASVGLGIAQSAAGLPGDAAATFEDGLRRFPQDATHRVAYGVLLVKMAEGGNGTARAKAVAMFEAALELDASLPEPRYQLALLSLDAGDAAIALARLEEAERLGLSEPRLHYAAARALRRLGRTAEANERLAKFEAPSK
jgi:tetratricopeptide (TPR) repeat protein